MELTDKQTDIMRHMLGINDPYKRDPEPWRNYACVAEGGEQHKMFQELEKAGLVEEAEAPSFSEYLLYLCTDEGIRVAVASHADIRKSKVQRRYSAYLDLADVLQDLTFKEFLTSDEYAEIRQNT